MKIQVVDGLVGEPLTSVRTFQLCNIVGTYNYLAERPNLCQLWSGEKNRSIDEINHSLLGIFSFLCQSPFKTGVIVELTFNHVVDGRG